MALLSNNLASSRYNWRKAYTGVTNDTAPADNLIVAESPYVIGPFGDKADGPARNVIVAITGLPFGGTAEIDIYMILPLLTGSVLSVPSSRLEITATTRERAFNVYKGEQAMIVRVAASSAPIDVYIGIEGKL